jgi:PAS domain S-box-containing protein
MFTEVTGYTLAEARGRNPRVLKSGAQPVAFYEEMWRTILAGRTWRGEFHNKKKNGDLFWERASISPILGPHGDVTHFVAIKEDITEHKQLEARLRQTQKMEAVGRLAAGVAHDFNNLLTVILGYSDLLLGDPPLAETQRELLDEIKKAAERGAGLTRQLLAFSRQQVLEPQVLDLNTVVADCGRMLRRLVGEDIDLVITPEPGVKRVKADPGQLEQALINLVVNARDAIAQYGRITVETAAVTLDEEFCRSHPEAKPGPHIRLAVTDTGCGMDEATQARIFEPFFTTKERGKGTGLGLAMVFGFIKQSGGHVSVTSTPGQGSTFQVYLPALAEAAVAAGAETRREKPRGGRETILLAEDEAGVRMLVRLILTARGYTVLEAAGGAQALALARSHAAPIHLLISDVVMPGMSGPELVMHMQALKPGIRILLMSGYSGDALDRHGGLPASTFLLAKPFAVPVLELKVREILNGP